MCCRILRSSFVHRQWRTRRCSIASSTKQCVASSSQLGAPGMKRGFDAKPLNLPNLPMARLSKLLICGGHSGRGPGARPDLVATNLPFAGESTERCRHISRETTPCRGIACQCTNSPSGHCAQSSTFVLWKAWLRCHRNNSRSRLFAACGLTRRSTRTSRMRGLPPNAAGRRLACFVRVRRS